jgi:Regulator of chromosome condensation (RCC1) repeat
LKVKILNEIQKVSKPTLKAARLWAWGNNNNGQLAINKSHTTVSQPLEIALPNFKGDFEILDIACGMKQTVLVTKDELWMTNPVSKNPKKEEDEQPAPAQKKKSKKEKEKEKESEDFSKLGESQYWVNITKLVKNVE